jgi:alkylhydroperoxidase family enzyme
LVEGKEVNMAYRATVRTDIYPQPLSPTEIEPYRLAPMEAATFSPLEEQVIALACSDGLGSIEAPGWIERLVTRLFGLSSERRALADPRLEALRRAVVVARHRHHLPDMQAAELREAGFNVAQIRAIETKALGV